MCFCYPSFKVWEKFNFINEKIYKKSLLFREKHVKLEKDAKIIAITMECA
jgi:hypothetical protein